MQWRYVLVVTVGRLGRSGLDEVLDSFQVASLRGEEDVWLWAVRPA